MPMRKIAVLVLGAVVISATYLAFGTLSQPTALPQTPSQTQPQVTQPMPNNMQALVERVSKLESQLAHLSSTAVQLSNQVGNVDVVKLESVVAGHSQTLTNLTNITEVGHNSLDARQEALQQSIDALTQKVEADQQQLKATQQELRAARRSAQLALATALVGIGVALLFIFKVIS